MPNPKSKPALTKAPRKSHPLAPASPPPPQEQRQSGGRRGKQDPDGDGRVVFSTRIDADLRDQVRHAAIDSGMRVGDWVEAAISEKLARDQDK